MRNFAIACIAFLAWSCISLLLLVNEYNFNQFAFFGKIGHETPMDKHITNLDFLENGRQNSLDRQQDTLPVYKDNSLLQSELSDKMVSMQKNEPKKTSMHDPKVNQYPNVTAAGDGNYIYPSYSFGKIIENDYLIEHILVIKNYLIKNPKKKITLVGHSDDVGSSEDNYFNALKKAAALKWYLVEKLNINEKSISAISEGESLPISTDERKNDRIEIIFD